MKRELLYTIHSLLEKLPFVKKNEILKTRWKAPSIIEDTLSDKSKLSIQEFQHYHEKECDNGRKYSYNVSSTSGIGMGIEIECEKCGLKENVTDYEEW